MEDIFQIICFSIGILIALFIAYLLYKKGTFPTFGFRVIPSDKDKELLKNELKNAKYSFIALSGEFPPSFWNNFTDDLINLAKRGGEIKLVGGEVTCIGQEKNEGNENKIVYSEFLKKVIKANLPNIHFFKRKGNKITKHIGEYHFRTVDEKFSIIHYHNKDNKRKTIYIKNNDVTAKELRKYLEDYIAAYCENFNFENAAKENALVVEIKDNEKPSYRKATEEEIEGFKKFLNN